MLNKKYNNNVRVINQSSSNNTLHINVLKYYETLLKKNNLKNYNIHFEKTKMILKVKGKFKNLIEVIHESKKHYKISFYSLYQKNKKLYLDIEYSLKSNYKYHIQTNKLKIKNPFTNKRARIKKNTNAIISNYVYIKTKWYKLNDRYKSYVISKINKNSIELSNKKETIIMEIFNEK